MKNVLLVLLSLAIAEPALARQVDCKGRNKFSQNVFLHVNIKTNLTINRVRLNYGPAMPIDQLVDVRRDISYQPLSADYQNYQRYVFFDNGQAVYLLLPNTMEAKQKPKFTAYAQVRHGTSRADTVTLKCESYNPDL